MLITIHILSQVMTRSPIKWPEHQSTVKELHSRSYNQINMLLPDQAIKEFKKIYEAKFRDKLTDGEYRIRAEKFLSLFRLITKPTNSKKLLVK